jgi:hypothetical protein
MTSTGCALIPCRSYVAGGSAVDSAGSGVHPDVSRLWPVVYVGQVFVKPTRDEAVWLA